jgi:hypothetical protein
MKPKAVSLALLFLLSFYFKSSTGEPFILDVIGDLTASNGIIPEPVDSVTNYKDKSMEFGMTFQDKLADAFGTSIEAVMGIWAISDDPLDMLQGPLLFKLPASELESFTVTYYSPIEARLRFFRTPNGDPYPATTTRMLQMYQLAFQIL